jgi:DNA polymerase elongation subunit (family B)
MDYKGWQKNVLDDSKLWRDFMKVYEQADITIGYFNTGFDRPYMYAKLLKHGLPIPANTPTLDLFYTVKSNMKLRRKSMDNVTRYLDLQNEQVHKTHVGGDLWQRARIGDPEGIKSVIQHCYDDILLTEQLYYRLRPLIRTHPRIAGFGPCRACGSQKLTRQGYRLTTTQGKQIRLKCSSCGSWDSVSEQGFRTKVSRYVDSNS